MPKISSAGPSIAGQADPVIAPVRYVDRDVEVAGTGRLITEQGLRVAGVDLPTSLVHNWDVDGWAPFKNRHVSAQGTADTASVEVAGRGRITGHAEADGGNNREAWMREGTYWEDSEILSLWWGGSIYHTGTATPQMGVGHRMRVHDDGTWSGVIVWQNIFLSDPDVINLNIWHSSVDQTELTQGSNGVQKDFGAYIHRALPINSSLRFQFGTWINSHTVTSKHYLETLQIGDVCAINSNDSTFNGTVALTGVDATAGSISHDEPTTESAVALKVDAGTCSPPTHKKYWPYWVRSQLIGDRLRVKVWRYQDREPDWGSINNVETADLAGDNTPLPNAANPTVGYCGLVSAHLRNSAYIEYGHTEFIKLDGAA